MWDSLRLAAFSFLLANLFNSALSVPIQKPLKCNGHQELCDRSYGNTTFLGSHDSFSISTNPWILARNQEIPLIKQLNMGVRMLQVQAHMNGDAIHLCHTACFLFDGNTFEAYLKQVKSFLDKNTDEVVTIVIANPEEIPPSAFKKIFEASGVANIAYSPPQLLMKRDDWPTLGEMITAGKRVVVFMDKGFPPVPSPPAPAPPSSTPATTTTPSPASSSTPATTTAPSPASSSKPATTAIPAPASTTAPSPASSSKPATTVSSRSSTTKTTSTTISVQVKLSARPDDSDDDDCDDLDPRSDGDDDSDVNTEYIIPQFPVMWEDPYDPQDLEFQCRVDRTQGPLKPNQQLNLINHNLNYNFIPLGHGLRIPNRWWASVTNKVTSIVDHAGNCTQLTDGKNPNFVLLDWVNVGQGARAVDILNGFN